MNAIATQDVSRAIVTRNYEKALRATELSQEMGFGMTEVDTTDGGLVEIIFQSSQIRQTIEMKL